MLHKAWNNIEEVPYCFQGHPSNFKVTQDRKASILTQIGRFQIGLQLKFTDGYEMMHKAWSNIEEAPCCFSRLSIKFQGHMGQKIADFDPNWAFPDYNSSLNTPMDWQWCTNRNVVKKRCRIVFWGQPSNCKFTRAEKSTLCVQFE